jgi:DHA1 family bicyclomycin/chloramphenicol resistance-like MFS transporter
VFLIFRMAQAVIAAGMVLSRAVVRDMVADAEAASMIGYVTMGMSLVPMIGPVIGGVLDDLYGWQANFALLLVLGLGVLALVWADLGETAEPARASAWTTRSGTYPALLASRRFWGYTLSAAFASGCFFAYLGGAPYVGDKIFGLSSTHVGALFALTAIGYAAGNFLAGRFSVRVGMNRMILIGTMVTTAAWRCCAADAGGAVGAGGVLRPDHLHGPWQRHLPAERQCRACCRSGPNWRAPPRALAARS